MSLNSLSIHNTFPEMENRLPFTHTINHSSQRHQDCLSLKPSIRVFCVFISDLLFFCPMAVFFFYPDCVCIGEEIQEWNVDERNALREQLLHWYPGHTFTVYTTGEHSWWAASWPPLSVIAAWFERWFADNRLFHKQGIFGIVARDVIIFKCLVCVGQAESTPLWLSTKSLNSS